MSMCMHAVWDTSLAKIYIQALPITLSYIAKTMEYNGADQGNELSMLDGDTEVYLLKIDCTIIA